MKHFFPALLLAAAITRADSLPEILARMDASAKTFKSFSAKVHFIKFTAVLPNDKPEEEDGEFRMMRSKGGTVGIADFKGKDVRTVHFAGHEVQIYHPKANSVEIYDSSKFTRSMDQFLTLGFGTTAADLNKTYDITLGGSEMLGGAKTTRIELIPKSEETRKNLFTKIELWIPEGGSHPIQEKVTEPSHNTTTITFADINLNPKLQPSDFDLKLPSGVKKLRPQR